MHLQIEEQFDRIALEYDVQRAYLVPCLEDFYGIARTLLDLDKSDPNILDMGAGTGLLTQYIYEKYPEGKYTLIDLSQEMLKVAKERFSLVNDVVYCMGDYCHYDYIEYYDAVISALSIHHLSDEGKQAAYNKAYERLTCGGIFINADQVLGNDEDTEALNRKHWLRLIEASPLSHEEKQMAYNRMALDQMTTLQANMEMIRNSGFRHVEVYYKYYNFAVIRGVK